MSVPTCDPLRLTATLAQLCRELIKLTFNLKVDRDELGAILKAFDGDISEQNSNINASDFLRYFLR